MQRQHPSDIFGSLWSKVDSFIENGIVISSEEVYDEIHVGDDDLVSWAKNRKDKFLKSDHNIQQLVREILQKQPSLVTGSKKINGADPFVIALAKIKNCKLVSDERRSGVGQPIKIPNVCEEYGVECIRFIDFLREMKIAI